MHVCANKIHIIADAALCVYHIHKHVYHVMLVLFVNMYTSMALRVSSSV